MNRVFKISGRLASHFQADEITAADIKANYDSAVMVLAELERFPNADVATLEFLAESLFDLSPLAAMEGSQML